MQLRGLQCRLMTLGDAARHRRAAGAGQPLHLGIYRTSGIALGYVKVVLQPFQQKIEHRDDKDVIKRHGRHRLHDQKVLRVELLADHQYFGQGDHRHQRTELHDGDIFIGQRRQGDAQRLGDDHPPLDPGVAQPQGPRGFALPARDGEQSAAVDLGDIGRFAEDHRQQAGPEGIVQHRGEGGQRLRHVVDKNQQDQQRHTAK